jgi:two-component system, NtrC family, sensor kinase
MLKIKILFFILFFTTALNLIAQNQLIIDSLHKELREFEAGKKSYNAAPDLSDSVKANILYRLSKEYWSGNLDSAFIIAEQVLKLSGKISYKKGRADALSSIGVVYWLRGEYENALIYSQRSLEIRQAIGDKKEIAKSLHNVGLVYDDQGNFTEALNYYLKALKLNEELNDKSGIALEHNTIGIIYFNQKNYEAALKNHLYSLSIRKETGDKWDLTESYSNIGVVYFEMGNYEECMKYYNEALKLRLEIDDRQGIAISYNNFGDVYLKERNYTEALKFYQQALDINKKIGYKKSIADVYLNMGIVYQQQGNLSEAVKKTNDALTISQELGALDYVNNGYGRLAQLHALTGNYKKAYEYEQLFKQTNDSLFNSGKAKELTRLQLQYDFNKKHLADSLKFAQQKQLSEIKLSRQRIFTYGGFGGLLVVIFLLFFVYRNYDKQRKANNQLRDTQQQLIQAEKLASLGGLTAGIAHEIQNPLNFVNNFSDLSNELISEIKESSNEEDKNQILKDLENNLSKISFHGKRADSIVQNMLQHARSGSAEKSLTDINKICDEFAGLAYHGIKAANPDFKCEVVKMLDKNLPRIHVISQDISRVILNLLNNAFYAVKEKSQQLAAGSQQSKDYNPSVQIVTLSLHHFITIKIRDNGKGIPENVKQKIFDPFFTTKPAGEGTGLGLSISYDIIKAHGGEMKVESKENEFAEFIISIPSST